ncbi:Ubiquinone biosynthesis O-methyltransferase [subsurface metagenome]
MILDLHIHSKYSFDSILEPKRIIKVAKNKGLDGIAITDHNTIKGGLEVEKINKDHDFLVIVGSEISTEVGDITGLFLNEEIKSRNSMEVIEEIKEQGGIVVLPHPYKGHKLNDGLISSVDVIESFNSRTGRYENFFAEELAEKYKKPTIAGSDAHFESEIGMAKTLINSQNLESVKYSIISGNTTIFDCQQSYGYLQNYSQLIKTIKNKKYISCPALLVKTVVGYVFKVNPKFVIPEVVPNDELQADLDGYQKYYNSWLWRYQHRQRINNVIDIIERLKINEEDKILEIGCGRGIYTTLLARKSRNVVSIELSNREIRVSKEFVEEKQLNKNVTLIRADAQRLPFKEDIFDFVLCSEVLEHLDDPSKGALELNRVLKHGKKALVSMPNLISYFWMRQRVINELRDRLRDNKIEIDPHMKFPYWRIVSLLEQAGFRAKPLRGTHLFSGGLIFGFLINIFPSFIHFLNWIEWKLNFKYLSAFFFVEGEKE